MGSTNASRKARPVRRVPGGDGSGDHREDRSRVPGQAEGSGPLGCVEGGEYTNGLVRGRIGIFGKSGSGKSTELLELCDSVSRCLIFDTLGNFCGRNQAPPGYTVFRNTKALKEFLREHIRLPFRAIYQPTSGNKAEQFEQVCYLAYRAAWLVLAVDEVDSFCTASAPSVIDGAALQRVCPGADNYGLYEISNYSRHKPMAFVFTSRRPAQVARGLTSQCSELRVYLTTEDVDLAYFSGIMGRSNAEQLKTLGNFYYLRYQDGLPLETGGGPR
jgi:hypothetical protein